MAYEKDTSWINGAVDKHYNGDDSEVKVLLGGLGKAFSEMTVEDFAAMVEDYFKSAKHPTCGCSYLDVAYQPMLELLGYLKANDFTIFIVSGGGREVYGIQPERVVGSAPTLSFKADDQGATIIRGAGLDILDDGDAKAIQIWDRIGRRPILAGGNSNGDIPMLQLADGSDRPALCLLVHHDDDKREVKYSAGAEKSVTMAQAQGWTLISMKDDWGKVFSFQDG
jgi:hypothetical protein